VSAAAADDVDVRGWSVVSGLGRVAIGIGMLAAPERAMRGMGFDDVGPATVAVSRVAGVRDLVLGVLTVAALDDRERLRTATLANAVADAGDSLAFGAALATPERTAAARGLALALPAALVGALIAWRLG
jgi:hypothetical protein